ncbi:hypothetical protein RJ639_006512 [Escallonia herrerae]|uniref:Serine-threonine protein phosphatase N-terminal domain-containing protein n=1 Tax=Escallonia herrerae TaxID=1293975 RepID=A0AA89AVK1_9ASTE|nr:hypothetical protein RJ639_006512 [Escallonia herrerae]
MASDAGSVVLVAMVYGCQDVVIYYGGDGGRLMLSESEIRQLCLRSRDIFLQQPNLLELEAPIKICESP